MDKQSDDLKKAWETEQDHKVLRRIVAVHMVRVLGKHHQEVAKCLMRSPSWVSICVAKYDCHGVDGLQDLPRQGRPSKVPIKTITKIIHDIIKTKTLVTPPDLQKKIYKETRVKYNLFYVKKLIKKHNLPTPIHTV